mmetsp:Transcript_70048/g.196000  ORF Transcript_70048/g.196000 Transcript_70048/m.196000 type:complete len:279 (-) Transcript_70048:1158-1994(-)
MTYLYVLLQTRRVFGHHQRLVHDHRILRGLRQRGFEEVGERSVGGLFPALRLVVDHNGRKEVREHGGVLVAQADVRSQLNEQEDEPCGAAQVVGGGPQMVLQLFDRPSNVHHLRVRVLHQHVELVQRRWVAVLETHKHALLDYAQLVRPVVEGGVGLNKLLPQRKVLVDHGKVVLERDLVAATHHKSLTIPATVFQFLFEPRLEAARQFAGNQTKRRERGRLDAVAPCVFGDEDATVHWKTRSNVAAPILQAENAVGGGARDSVGLLLVGELAEHVLK